MTESATVPRLVVAIAPSTFDETRLTLEQCRSVVTTSQVRVRGWYFPHIDREAGFSVGEAGRYITNGITWSTKDETWRMQRSGQFLFRSKLWEVGDEGYQAKLRTSARYALSSINQPDEIPGFISLVGLIYSVAEIYSFATNLSQAASYDSLTKIEILLRGATRWALAKADDSSHINYLYRASTDLLKSAVTVPIDDLVSDPLKLSSSATVSLFEQFSWLDVRSELITGWQRQIFRR